MVLLLPLLRNTLVYSKGYRTTPPYYTLLSLDTAVQMQSFLQTKNNRCTLSVDLCVL